MPREGTHIRRTNYAVNLRVYTRTRNNAGNFGRLHGSRGNAQRCIPCARGRRGTRLRRIMWRSAWFMRADALLSLCQCLSLSLLSAHTRKTSELQLFTSGSDGKEREGEVQPMVTNEREKGEKVHMRGATGSRIRRTMVQLR